MISRKKIEIAAKLYECQRTLQRLWGEQYAEKIQPWKEELQRLADKHEGGQVLKVALPILTAQDKAGEGMQMMCVMAACVELIEPREEEKKGRCGKRR